MAESLTTVADVEGVLGRDLTPSETARVDSILEKLSALARTEARRLWADGSSTVRLQSVGGKVRLPERIVEVESVADDCGNPISYRRQGQVLETGLPSSQFATVTYEHTADVPDLVRLTLAEAAAQIVPFDPASLPAGATKVDETAGPFRRTVTYADWVLSGRRELSDDDRVLMRGFRPRGGRVHVLKAPA